jgi:membrane protein
MSFTSAVKLLGQAIGACTKINAPRLAASIAFYAMLSIAPLLIISISIAEVALGTQTGGRRMLDLIQQQVGLRGGPAVQSLLLHSGQSTGLFGGLLGIIVLLIGASGVVVELRDSLNLVWGVETPVTGVRGILRSRLFSFALILGIGSLMVISLVAGTLIAVAGRFVHPFLPAQERLLQLGNTLLSFILTTVLFALLYKVLPDTHIEWRDVAFGAAAASAVFSLGKLLIGLYIAKAAIVSVYGAAASLVAFLVWVYCSAQILLWGAQLTRLFAERYGSRALPRMLPDTASGFGS